MQLCVAFLSQLSQALSLLKGAHLLIPQFRVSNVQPTKVRDLITILI